MQRHLENWKDMKHEPRKFWSAKTTFFIYAKLFPYTISYGESQTPLLRFLLRGEGVCTQASFPPRAIKVNVMNLRVKSQVNFTIVALR